LISGGKRSRYVSFMPTHALASVVYPIANRLLKWNGIPADRRNHAHGLASWAGQQMDAARIGERLYAGKGVGIDLSDIDQHPFWPLEIAAGNLVFRCVATALDLCAASASHLSDSTALCAPPKREADVHSAKLPQGSRFSAWLNALQDRNWDLLIDLRDQYTHRNVRRDLFIGGPTRAEVRDSRGNAHDLATIFTTVIRFGDEQIRAFWSVVDGFV
jgi:hypothetical protein